MAGEVDQSAGMLDEEVKDKGYALLCVSEPTSDCTIRTIEEVLNALLLPPFALLLSHIRLSCHPARIFRCSSSNFKAPESLQWR